MASTENQASKRISGSKGHRSDPGAIQGIVMRIPALQIYPSVITCPDPTFDLGISLGWLTFAKVCHCLINEGLRFSNHLSGILVDDNEFSTTKVDGKATEHLQDRKYSNLSILHSNHIFEQALPDSQVPRRETGFGILS